MAGKKKFPLSIVIGAVDKATAPLLRIRKKLNRFMAPVKRLQKSIRRFTNAAGFNVMGKAIKRVGGATVNLAKQMGSLGVKLGGLAALAGGFAFNMVNGFTKVGDAAAKTAKAIGLSAEQVQEYEFIAERSGVSQGVLNSSLIAFSKRLGELKAGTGGLFTMLKKVNPELLRQLETTEDTSEAMDMFLGFIGSVEEESKQAALAAAGFSRSGVKMVNVAKEGAEGIKALREEAHKLGLIIDNESAAAAEKFQDKMTNLRSAMTGVRNIIGGSLLPIVQEFVERLTKFIVGNRADIEKWAQSFAKSIPTFDQIKKSVMDFVNQLKPLLKFMGWINEHIGLVNAALIALGLWMGGGLIVAVLQAAVAIKSLGLAISLTPVGWFLGAVAAIAAAVFMIYKNWDGIVAFFTDKLDKVKEAFGEGFIKGIWTLFKEFNPFNLLLDALNDLIAKFTGFDFAAKFKGMFGGFLSDGEQQAQRPQMMRAGSGVHSAGGNQQSQAKVTVDFSNLPIGARILEDSGNDADLSLGMGFSMGTS